MGFIRGVLSMIIEDPDEVRKLEVRSSVLFSALITFLDVVTDAWFIYEIFRLICKEYTLHGVHVVSAESECNFQARLQIGDTRVVAFIMITSILTISKVLSVVVYVRTSAPVTMSGVLLYLAGLGIVYEAIPIWRSAVYPPWDSDNESDEEGTKLWKFYIYSRAAESIFEAAPFAVFQCGWLVGLENYEPWLVFSIILSVVNTGIPVVDFLKFRCVDNSILNIHLSEQLTIIFWWSLDIMVRNIPTVYMFAHFDRSGRYDDQLYEEYGLQENHYELDKLGWICGVALIVEVVSVNYFYIGVRQTCIRKSLVIIASSLILYFFSYPKLRAVGSRWWLETFSRFSLSIVVMLDVWKRNLVRFWQVALFVLVTIVTGIFQMYVWYHIDSAVYTGSRIESRIGSRIFSRPMRIREEEIETVDSKKLEKLMAYDIGSDYSSSVNENVIFEIALSEAPASPAHIQP